MTLSRRAVLATATLGLARVGHAQGWPEQHITWVVPYAGGGGSDVMARLVGEALGKSLGQSIIVDNKPGGSTIIGATYLQGAKADGYIIGTVDSATLAFNPALFSKLSYDPNRFTIIGGLAQYPLGIAVRAESPIRSMQDLLTAARKAPGTLSCGTAGAGSPHHLALELFHRRAGVKLLHVPYKGAAPAILDLVGGQLDVGVVDTASGLANIKAKKIRVLAVATPQRLTRLLPDVPTMAEVGIKNYTAYAWQGIVAPPGLPSSIAGMLSVKLETTLRSAEMDARIRDMGVEPMPMSARQFEAFAQKERKDWAEVIRLANIKVE